jgi:hypothetical protein
VYTDFLDPILDFKYPNTASGATPIGNVGRTPKGNEDVHKRIVENFESMIADKV